jgi:hypothetical protein
VERNNRARIYGSFIKSITSFFFRCQKEENFLRVRSFRALEKLVCWEQWITATQLIPGETALINSSLALCCCIIVHHFPSLRCMFISVRHAIWFMSVCSSCKFPLQQALESYVGGGREGKRQTHKHLACKSCYVLSLESFEIMCARLNLHFKALRSQT